MAPAGLTSRLSHRHHVTRQGSSKTLDRPRRAITSLQPRPRLRLLEQRPQLAEQRTGRRPFSVEPLDAVESSEQSSRFVHEPTLA